MDFNVFVYDPITKELKYTKPRGVEIPESAYQTEEPPIIVKSPKSTSPLLVVLLVIFILILIFTLIYLVWIVFIKKSTDTPLSFFLWLTGRG